jgi:3-oxoacyl-[acyl-carrier-protein] synthase III
MKSVQRYEHVAISGLAHVDAPHVRSSKDIETELAPTLDRLGIPAGLLESLSGIVERRLWDPETQPSQFAAAAGEAALKASGVGKEDLGIVLNTSVCRDFLEPSTASIVHGLMDLDPTTINFDIGNACLGFVNGMNVVASMIERGEIEHGLVVDAETSRVTLDATTARLASDACDDRMFREQFATLTLGSGAVAMLLSRDDSPDSHRFLGGLSRAATAHAGLCVGDIREMRTDTKGLLMAGLELAASTWKDALADFDWDPDGVDTYVLHQVSKVHTKAVCDTLGLDINKFPLIYPTFGNIGPAGLPTVLSKAVADETVRHGDRVMFMGVGSGINVAAAEIIW